jgi:hypothetical protein
MTNENGVRRLPNGSTGEIRIRISEFKGKTYVDIRKWYFSPPENSTPQEDADRPAEFFKPTTKGISLTPEQWENVVPEIKQILEAEVG